MKQVAHWLHNILSIYCLKFGTRETMSLIVLQNQQSIQGRLKQQRGVCAQKLSLSSHILYYSLSSLSLSLSSMLLSSKDVASAYTTGTKEQS